MFGMKIENYKKTELLKTSQTCWTKIDGVRVTKLSCQAVCPVKDPLSGENFNLLGLIKVYLDLISVSADNLTYLPNK